MSSAHSKRQRQAWTAERLREQAALPGPINPALDGVPAPEYIPEMWIGPHCGLRMIEAFKTLGMMPNRKLSTGGGFWPDYWPEWQDMLAREQSELELKEERERQQNKARVMPSAQDISRMEIVISWAAHYLLPEQAKLVQYIALMRSRDCDIDAVAHRLWKQELQSPRQRWRMKQVMLADYQKQMRKANRDGLDLIALGLRADKIEVF